MIIKHTVQWKIMSGRRVRRCLPPLWATTPVFGAPALPAMLTHSLTHWMGAETNWEPWQSRPTVSPVKEHGSTWDFLFKWKWEEEMNKRRKCSRCHCCALCPGKGQSAHCLLELHSNKNIIFPLRASIGNTASYAVDCCGYCQESWQRKHTCI